MSKFYIIHMFNKHVSEITSYLEQIASNGYTHILISPVTLCNLVDGNVWWSRYQPLSYEIGSSVFTRIGPLVPLGSTFGSCPLVLTRGKNSRSSPELRRVRTDLG